MRKIFSILLAWMLVLPGFAAAADDVALPPVPASGNVTLSLDEYNRLVELASKPARKLDTPPVPYTMKRADLKFRVANESVQGTVQLQGEILHKGATKIPLTNGHASRQRNLGRALVKNFSLQLHRALHRFVRDAELQVGTLHGVRNRRRVQFPDRLACEFDEPIVFVEGKRDVARSWYGRKRNIVRRCCKTGENQHPSQKYCEDLFHLPPAFFSC